MSSRSGGVRVRPLDVVYLLSVVVAVVHGGAVPVALACGVVGVLVTRMVSRRRTGHVRAP